MSRGGRLRLTGFGEGGRERARGREGAAESRYWMEVEVCGAPHSATTEPAGGGGRVCVRVCVQRGVMLQCRSVLND